MQLLRKRGQNVRLYSLHLLMQLIEDAKVCKEPNKGKKAKGSSQVIIAQLSS